MRDPLSMLSPAPSRLQGYRDAGVAAALHANALLPRVAERWPWLPAVSDVDRTLTYRNLADEVGRLSSHLKESGVVPGDVVVWQTPNWWESMVLALAIWHVGAVSSPVVMFYRHNELRHIIGQMKPDVVVTVTDLRKVNHADIVDEILAEARIEPKAKILFRGSAPGWTSYDQLPAAALSPPAAVDAEQPCLVLYTSGTTAAAKGAIHTSRSLLAATQVLVREWGISWRDTGYLAAPIQHVTGLMIGVTLPVGVGGHTVLADGWQGKRAVEDILDHGATYSAGTTLFLQELTEAAEASSRGPLPLRVFSCGGSPTPAAVIERADKVGIPAVRIYGMTELPCVSLGHPTTPFLRRAGTDGAVSPGVEVKAVDEHGSTLPAGAQGELLVRGPGLISGYVDPAANDGLFDELGWFRTGDLGLIDRDGDVCITGRIKDIINRGGEKLSSREIEDRLMTYPGIRGVAVVPAPDSRLGEVPAAFLITDTPVAAQALIQHLLDAGLPRQKTPVYWRFIDRMPTTAAGKIRKFELVTQLATELATIHEEPS